MNNKLHIICGTCGCNEEFCFEVDETKKVWIHCNNCSTTYFLNDFMLTKEEVQAERDKIKEKLKVFDNIIPINQNKFKSKNVAFLTEEDLK
jgi:hypothetical protein